MAEGENMNAVVEPNSLVSPQQNQNQNQNVRRAMRPRM